MYTLQNDVMLYALDDKGFCCSARHMPTNHEWIEIPGAIWKLIYSVPGTERVESVIWQENQHPVITQTGSALRLH